MALVDHQTREVTFKIVYAGTPLGGKTTNLQYVHTRLDAAQRGDLVSVATASDRTLYFDFMPVTATQVSGFTAKFALYTVPGQVHYNATRQLVLRGADGLVFVADSAADRLEENLESARSLMRNLQDNSTSLDHLPLVLQYNKRDLPDAAPRAHLDYLLNRPDQPFPVFETVAHRGVNVFACLNAVSQLVLRQFQATMTQAASTSRPASAPSPSIAS
ncbi:MAG: GTP-binding protein [Verrucomicrobiales bacterium]